MTHHILTNDNNPHISIIILNYNRCNQLHHTLLSIRDLHYSNYDVIVVDNASEDGSVDYLIQHHPQIQLIQLKKNIGIAGWNEGMKVATGDYFLCLDDDSYPLPDMLQQTVKHLSQDTIIAYKIINPAGEWDTPFFNSELQQQSFIGCGVLIPRRVFETIGGFNEHLFIYHHEIEYSIRALDKGFKILYLEHALICHTRSVENRNIVRRIDTRFLYYSARNSIIILLSYFTFSKVLTRLIRIILGKLLFGIYTLHITVVLKAIIDGLLCWLRIKKCTNKASDKTQKYFQYGKYIGSFFGDGRSAFRRPAWLRGR